MAAKPSSPLVGRVRRVCLSRLALCIGTDEYDDDEDDEGPGSYCTLGCLVAACGGEQVDALGGDTGFGGATSDIEYADSQLAEEEFDLELRKTVKSSSMSTTPPRSLGISQGCEKVDVLFVIDNSSSMEEFQANLDRQLPRIRRGDANGTDRRRTAITSASSPRIPSRTCLRPASYSVPWSPRTSEPAKPRVRPTVPPLRAGVATSPKRTTWRRSLPAWRRSAPKAASKSRRSRRPSRRSHPT